MREQERERERYFTYNVRHMFVEPLPYTYGAHVINICRSLREMQTRKVAAIILRKSNRVV